MHMGTMPWLAALVFFVLLLIVMFAGIYYALKLLVFPFVVAPLTKGELTIWRNANPKGFDALVFFTTCLIMLLLYQFG